MEEKIEQKKCKIRVKINESETYEFSLNESLSREDFLGLTERLLVVSKSLVKNSFSEETEKEIKSSPKAKRNVIFGARGLFNPKIREDLIECGKLYYSGSKEERKAFADKFESNWEYLKHSFYSWRKRYDVKAEEVGLERFPVIGEGHAKKIKLGDNDGQKEN